MNNYHYDLFVIGAGSGGMRAARLSAAYGAKVAIAEERYLGGTCVNVGCVPKKLLVYASRFAEEFEIAAGFGWSAKETAFRWPRLIENKNAEIGRLNGVYRKILDDNGVETLIGRATLVDDHTIRINGEDVTARYILIATGGWPRVPAFPGKEHVITSNEAFFLDELPERMIIVGGGYIAVEFAGIFHGLGVDTTLLYRGPLFLRGFDHEVRNILAEEMQKKGVKLEFNTNIERIEKNNAGFTVFLDNGETRVTGLVMYATGRRPNTSNIGLDKTNVKLNDKGAIIINNTYQSSTPSIYAIGDVTDRMNLTPVAIAEGIAFAKTVFGRHAVTVDYEYVPTCIFSQPSLGAVGLTEERARERYGEIDIYKSRFRPLKLSLTASTEKTFMKLVVDRKSGKVVGAHMIGEDAGEIIQGIAIAIKAGATKATFDTTIGIHPTAAEEFVTMRAPA